MATVTVIRTRTLRDGRTSALVRIYNGSKKGQRDERYETVVGDETDIAIRVGELQLDALRGRLPTKTTITTFGELMRRVYGLPTHPKRRGPAKAWTPAGKSRVKSAIDCYLDPQSREDDDEWAEWLRYLDPPGPRRFDKLDVLWWEAFFARVEARNASGRRSAGSSVNRLRSIVAAAYEQARKWKIITDNPITDCTTYNGTRRRVRPPTEAELDVLLAFIRAIDLPFFTMVYLTADLGERRGEGCAFRWEDIDFEDGTIGIGARLSLGEDGPEFLEHTKASDEDSPRRSLSPETLDLLKIQQEWVREHMLRHDLVLTSQSWVFPRIFPGSIHDNPLVPWRPDYVTTRFTKLRKRAGIDPAVTFHKLRHYVATEMISEGVDYATVAARLGNSQATVRQTYAHWSRQADEKAVAVHGRKLAALGKPKLQVVAG